MHGKLVGEILAAASRLNGVDIADHVGDGNVRGSQFLDVALVGGEPGNGSLFTQFVDQIAAAPADGMVRVIANLATGDVGNGLVEQSGEHPDDACLGLAPQPKQNEV